MHSYCTCAPGLESCREQRFILGLLEIKLCPVFYKLLSTCKVLSFKHRNFAGHIIFIIILCQSLSTKTVYHVNIYSLCILASSDVFIYNSVVFNSFILFWFPFIYMWFLRSVICFLLTFFFFPMTKSLFQLFICDLVLVDA